MHHTNKKDDTISKQELKIFNFLPKHSVCFYCIVPKVLGIGANRHRKRRHDSVLPRTFQFSSGWRSVSEGRKRRNHS
jgi:hypothetical protein